MNKNKSVKGICKNCGHSHFEGARGKNQKLVCNIVSGAPHGRYPSMHLKECPGFVEITSEKRKINARRLQHNK